MTETKQRRQPPNHNAANSGRAEIKTFSGALTLFVDDRPWVPIVLNASTANGRSTEIPVDGPGLFRVELDNLCWPSTGELNAAAVDNALLPLIKMPGSYRFLLSIRVDAPDWWLGSNPKEQVEYARRYDAHTASPTPPLSSSPTRTQIAPSLVAISPSPPLPLSPSPRPRLARVPASHASTRWRQSAGEALERLLRYVLKSPIGGNLIGVHILAGESGAFIYPDAERMPDVGPCMTLAFIKYTVDKYRRNEGLLRKAWFDTRAEFSGIRCPTAGEREKAEFGLFRNPHRSRKLMDYYECLANEQAAAALSFCSVVKRMSAGRLLAGLDSAQLTPQTSTAECGHTFPDQVLESSEVDFFVETGGSAGGVFRPFRGSAALHGKFVFIQAAASSPSSGSAAVFCAAADGVGAIIDPPETAKGLLELANLASGWAKRLSRPHKRQTQIALMLDPGAGLVISHRPDAAPVQTLVLDQIALLRRAGIVFSTYSIGDMFHTQFPDHRVYLFPNCFYLSEPERRKLDARVKRSAQTAVWFWCPGIIGEEGITAEVGTKCCGQKLRIEANEISMRSRIVDSNDPLTWGRHAGDVFGSELPAAPRCTVADSKASRLGANTDNKTSFSVRRFDTWTSVVYGALPCPLDLIQNLFRGAASHIYCAALKDGDRLATDGRVLFVYSREGGAYTLSLPGQVDVMDIVNGTKAGSGVSEIAVSLSSGQSAVFELRVR